MIKTIEKIDTIKQEFLRTLNEGLFEKSSELKAKGNPSLDYIINLFYSKEFLNDVEYKIFETNPDYSFEVLVFETRRGKKLSLVAEPKRSKDEKTKFVHLVKGEFDKEFFINYSDKDFRVELFNDKEDDESLVTFLEEIKLIPFPSLSDSNEPLFENIEVLKEVFYQLKEAMNNEWDKESDIIIFSKENEGLNELISDYKWIKNKLTIGKDVISVGKVYDDSDLQPVPKVIETEQFLKEAFLEKFNSALNLAAQSKVQFKLLKAVDAEVLDYNDKFSMKRAKRLCIKCLFNNEEEILMNLFTNFYVGNHYYLLGYLFGEFGSEMAYGTAEEYENHFLDMQDSDSDEIPEELWDVLDNQYALLESFNHVEELMEVITMMLSQHQAQQDKVAENKFFEKYPELKSQVESVFHDTLSTCHLKFKNGDGVIHYK